ncbi:MAG: hypothetical protein PUB86_05500 [Elusimicrobia bacterium]|nr:hypothetical protein [Elusimicrobiota bacterium]
MPKAVLQADQSNINILQADVLILLKQEPAVQTDLGAIGAEAARLSKHAIPLLNLIQLKITEIAVKEKEQ